MRPWRKAGHTRNAASAATPRLWRARVAVAAACAVLGSLAVASSLANVAIKTDAATAHLLAPSNGFVTAAFAEQLFAVQPSGDSRSRPARYAREALLQDATAVKALTVLGFQAQLRAEPALADRYFTHSIQLSRRELRPQLWAIEDAVTRGDIAGALRKYDLALRTSIEAQRILFPILAGALREPKIRGEMLRILATRPVWDQAFIAHAAAAGSDPISIARFLEEGRSIPLPVTDTESAALVRSLFNAGHFNQAWSRYASLRREARRDSSRDANFRLVTAERTPFDWNTGDGTALSVAILEKENGGVLDFSMPPSVGGLVVSQVLMLPAGSYRLNGRSTGLEQPASSLPYWSLSCLEGKELGRVPMPSSSQADGRFSGTFTVPEGCVVQTLSLIARATDDIDGVSGRVLHAHLQREAKGGTS